MTCEDCIHYDVCIQKKDMFDLLKIIKENNSFWFDDCSLCRTPNEECKTKVLNAECIAWERVKNKCRVLRMWEANKNKENDYNVE